MSARTPGEWIAKQMLNHAQFVILWPDNSKGGMHMRRVDAGGTFREPDAHLIASAPNMKPIIEFVATLGLPEDLYELDEGEALDETQRECFISYGMIRAARAAIRKATGETA